MQSLQKEVTGLQRWLVMDSERVTDEISLQHAKSASPAPRPATPRQLRGGEAQRQRRRLVILLLQVALAQRIVGIGKQQTVVGALLGDDLVHDRPCLVDLGKRAGERLFQRSGR